ncbi:MAG: hypothetical protein IKM45_04905, partial [Opitutales bacterium]|nr:hypothetical protein [Opitutales bacterium]
EISLQNTPAPSPNISKKNTPTPPKKLKISHKDSKTRSFPSNSYNNSNPQCFFIFGHFLPQKKQIYADFLLRGVAASRERKPCVVAAP